MKTGSDEFSMNSVPFRALFLPNFREGRHGELRRISLPRTPVDKAKERRVKICYYALSLPPHTDKTSSGQYPRFCRYLQLSAIYQREAVSPSQVRQRCEEATRPATLLTTRHLRELRCS